MQARFLLRGVLGLLFILMYTGPTKSFEGVGEVDETLAETIEALVKKVVVIAVRPVINLAIRQMDRETAEESKLNQTQLDPVYKYVNFTRDQIQGRLDTLNNTVKQTQTRTTQAEADGLYTRSVLLLMYNDIHEIRWCVNNLTVKVDTLQSTVNNLLSTVNNLLSTQEQHTVMLTEIKDSLKELKGEQEPADSNKNEALSPPPNALLE